MTTIEYRGETWNLPPRGRFGVQIESTLDAILRAHERGEGIALYSAMDLRGRAKSFADRYERAFIRFARANPDKLESGGTGPRGGFGFCYKGDR
jgi:hypothetical protein